LTERYSATAARIRLRLRGHHQANSEAQQKGDAQGGCGQFDEVWRGRSRMARGFGRMATFVFGGHQCSVHSCADSANFRVLRMRDAPDQIIHSVK
jgi:hypothetical protein